MMMAGTMTAAGFIVLALVMGCDKSLESGAVVSAMLAFVAASVALVGAFSMRFKLLGPAN